VTDFEQIANPPLWRARPSSPALLHEILAAEFRVTYAPPATSMSLYNDAVAVVAQTYVDKWFPGRVMCRPSNLRLTEEFCLEVARYYDEAPAGEPDRSLLQTYDRLKQEILQQYEAIAAAGYRIVPWTFEGQPYRNAAHVSEQVCRSRTLYIYLTRNGHGPDRHGPESGWDVTHPMREPSPIEINGERLLYNDLFRAIHDFFGHITYACSFQPDGEFRATSVHFQMFSDELHPILFSEMIGQICWFFFGPHLLDHDGRVRNRHDSGYVPPLKRPYAPQKTFKYPISYIDRFNSLFKPTTSVAAASASATRHEAPCTT
jgi:hypothetical protein